MFSDFMVIFLGFLVGLVVEQRTMLVDKLIAKTKKLISRK